MVIDPTDCEDGAADLCTSSAGAPSFEAAHSLDVLLCVVDL